MRITASAAILFPGQLSHGQSRREKVSESHTKVGLCPAESHVDTLPFIHALTPPLSLPPSCTHFSLTHSIHLLCVSIDSCRPHCSPPTTELVCLSLYTQLFVSIDSCRPHCSPPTTELVCLSLYTQLFVYTACEVIPHNTAQYNRYNRYIIWYITQYCPQ